MSTVLLAALLLLAGWCRGQASPTSYHDPEHELTGHCWFRVEPLATNTSVHDTNAELRVDDVIFDKIKIEIERIRRTICLTPIIGNNRISVRCNPNVKTSSTSEIKLNVEEICKIKNSQLPPGQHIFYDHALMPLKGILREKRESSWTEYITKKETTSSSQVFSWTQYITSKEMMPSRPQARDDWVSRFVTHAYLAPPQAPVVVEHFDALQNNPNSWVSYIGGTWPALPNQGECGIVTVTNLHPLLFHGKRTLTGEWPWQVALYNNKHFTCGGTLVSRRHVVTAAHCVTHKGSQDLLSPDVLSVYLGIHNLRTSTQGVQMENVEIIIVHPQYSASSFTYDLAVIKMAGPVQVTDFVRPVCLWPEHLVDLSHVVRRVGSVVGWGFNENLLATEELGLVKMPIVSHEECHRVNGVFDRSRWDTSYCAGFRDDTTACYGDSGGGMVLKMRNTWYLRGLVSVTINDCDPSRYVIFTDVAKFLPWLSENIH